ncbi:MAG: hypothetical protein ACIAQZ_05275 [Sedimentisphaeraceae bacterium JB056]
MKKTALLMVVITAIIGFNAFAANVEVGDSLEQKAARAIAETEMRQESIMRQQLRKPFPKTGLWKYEWQAMANYHFNEDTAKADAELLQQAEETRGKIGPGFHWHAYLLSRIYMLYSSNSEYYPGRMSKAAQEAVLSMIYEWTQSKHEEVSKQMTDPQWIWRYWGSENHHLQFYVSAWSAVHVLKDAPGYEDKTTTDGVSWQEMAGLLDEYFKNFLSQRAMKGLFLEVESPGYEKYSLNTIFNLYDFADDPELKELTDKFLNLYYADWAVEQLNGMYGGSCHRAYSSLEKTESFGYISFGLGKMDVHPGRMSPATTSWRPNPLVAQLALAQADRGIYESISRRPGKVDKAGQENAVDPDGGDLLKYTYMTPDFMMGISMNSAEAAFVGVSAQNRRNYITLFDSAGPKTISTMRPQPSRGSVYNTEWGVQDKGVMILQARKHAKGQKIYFPNALKRSQLRGWIFIETSQAYGAIKVVDGKVKIRKPQLEDFRDRKGDVNAGIFIVLEKFESPIIFEVVAKDKYKSMNDFKKQILSNYLRFKDNELNYESAAYKNKLTLFADYSRPPMLNGKAIDLNPDFVYKSPFINAKFGEGKVSIKYGENELSLDFQIEKSQKIIDDFMKER